MTLFERIAAGTIPAKIVYRDEAVIAFHDIAPVAPVHVLVVPLRPVAGLADATVDDVALLGQLMFAASEVARMLGLTNGYRVVINQGKDGGQSVDHLHLHVMGGRPLGWPPG